MLEKSEQCQKILFKDNKGSKEETITAMRDRKIRQWDIKGTTSAANYFV